VNPFHPSPKQHNKMIVKASLLVLQLFALFLLSTYLLHVKSSDGIPTYYIDPKVESIFRPRYEACLRGSAQDELKLLKEESASEYYRSHELHSHTFFIENKENNIYRKQSLYDAEFEYIPFLPLHWRVNSSPKCSYSIMVQEILDFWKYTETRDKALNFTARQKFVIASTYNMRTEIGFGMPTQVRRGDAWNTVSAFTMALSIGHYERWPQCPDLLRKSWKYVVELPYVSPPSKSRIDELAIKKRKHLFHFSGYFELFGPELVCSVRNEIINLNIREDTLVVNASLINDARSKVRDQVLDIIEDSSFCLITKSDSYSTSFFYHAILRGCIPVVISDWWTFAFPWIVPYEKFVIRVLETDFLKNSNFVLDYIKDKIGNNADLLYEMRLNMLHYGQLLSWRSISTSAPTYHKLMDLDVYFKSTNSRSFESIIPLELLLLELRYINKPYGYYNSIPCMKPFMCWHNRLNKSYASIGDYNFFEESPIGTKTYHKSPDLHSGNFPLLNTLESGNPVKFLDIPAIPETRSHICKHVTRLIGFYKIVYYMQCVRILWPLTPGKWKPVDKAHIFDKFNNLPPEESQKVSVPYDGNGVSWEERNFILAFHNLSRALNWNHFNYPITNNTKKIVPLRRIN
jgi:hypothetical protein